MIKNKKYLKQSGSNLNFVTNKSQEKHQDLIANLQKLGKNPSVSLQNYGKS